MRRLIICFLSLIVVVLVAACSRSPGPGATPTMDPIAANARATIIAALSVTPPQLPTPEPTALPTSTPTDTDTPVPPPTPTLTPDLAASETVAAETVAAAVAATVAAQTTATARAHATATAIAATLTALAPPTFTPTPIPPTPIPPTPIPPTPIPPTPIPPPTFTSTPIPPTPIPTWTPTSVPPPSLPVVAAAGEPATVAGFTFVFVPAGDFLMGSNGAPGFEDETPPHTVYVDGFWIMRTEVTNAQWQRFVEAGGYAEPAYWSSEGWDWRAANGVDAPGCWWDGALNGPTQPVMCISWYEAEAFARWLSAETGVYVRLPTEAEWEKAARTTDGRTYPWGEAAPDGGRLNFCDRNCDKEWADFGADDSYRFTAPVGSYPAGLGPYGALDMAGNVWEWTGDWYDGGYYGQSPYANPTGPGGGSLRVARGGSFDDYYSWNGQRGLGGRASVRDAHPPDTRDDKGVRLVAPQ